MKSKLWREYDVPQEKIEMLRTEIYAYSREHPDEIDMNDLRNRIPAPEDATNNNLDTNNNRCQDWMLKRFLIVGHQDLGSAKQKLLEFLRFRKEFQLSQLCEENVFPSEIFKLCPFDDKGLDKDNNRVFVVRLKYYKKIPQFDFLIKRAMVYFSEKLDIEYENGQCDGVCLLLDCQDFAMASVDLNLLQFLVKQLPTFFIGLVRKILVFELPLLLSYVIKLVETWIPASTDKQGKKRRYFETVTRKNIRDHIDENQLVDFLSGSRTAIMDVPTNTKPFLQFICNIPGFDEKNIPKIQDYLAQLTKA